MGVLLQSETIGSTNYALGGLRSQGGGSTDKRNHNTLICTRFRLQTTPLTTSPSRPLRARLEGPPVPSVAMVSDFVVVEVGGGG